MLFLIGLGLDVKDLSIKALEATKSSSSILLDQYTNSIPEEYIKFIETSTGKSITKLSRSDLEERISATIQSAKTENVSLLVSGDPLMATTHQIILEECKKQGIKYQIIHGSSIITAVMGESGLIPYKFGRTTTIPFWTEKYKPVSFIDVIASNFSNDAHTIVLLDYNYLKNEGLGVDAAAEQLLKAEEQIETGVISKNTKILAMANIGKKDQTIIYTQLGNLLTKPKELSGKIVTLVVPTELTVTEKESLEGKGQ